MSRCNCKPVNMWQSSANPASASQRCNLIAGLDCPDGGRLVLDGIDYSQLDEAALTRLRRDKLGFIIQAFHILPHLNILQNVALPLWLQGAVQSLEILTRVSRAIPPYQGCKNPLPAILHLVKR